MHAHRSILPVLVTMLGSLAVALCATPSPASAAGCPNEAIRVGPSANLPDCRAYEQVTPVEKNSGVLEPVRMGVGPEGEPTVISESATALAGIGDNYGFFGGWYSTTRTAEGWATSAMPPPASGYQVSLVSGGISPWLNAGSLDGRASLWSARASGQPDDTADLFLARVPGPVVEDLGPIAPPGTPPGEVGTITGLNGLDFHVRGVSADLSHIVYSMAPEGGYHFWPFDATAAGGTEDLYEYIGVGNSEPLLVGVDDEGKLISTCGEWLGETHQFDGSAHNALSLDGKTAFFTASKCGSSLPVNELFARVDNGEAGAHTVAISEPTAVDCALCDTAPGVLAPAVFRGASTDDSKVFFTTTQPLLGGDTSENVYEYDFDAPAGERVIHVSAGDGTVSAPTAAVQGIVSTSEDGSHVYFVARGALTSNPNSQGQRAQAGADNFYVFERDERFPAGHVVFIASLSQSDEHLWTEGIAADTTPDGRFVVFASHTEHLTPDDTSASTQVFEYDAQSETLVRVSIGQDGYNHNGNTDIAEPYTFIQVPVFAEVSDPLKYWSGLTVSADGSYVFFQSSIGLTPQAIDHKLVGDFRGVARYAANVYEYHDGEVYLISDGRDTNESAVKLAGTDASGADVFFTTVDQLAPQDTDSDEDIYDARVDGGFPAPVPVSECTGDACQGPLSAAPVLLSPGSELQAGGNPPPAAPAPVVAPKAKPKPVKCKKNHVSKHGKCVKQPRAKKPAKGRK
jgi:hypothetical protein